MKVINVLKPPSNIRFVSTGIYPFRGKKGIQLLNELRQISDGHEQMKRLKELFYRKGI